MKYTFDELKEKLRECYTKNEALDALNDSFFLSHYDVTDEQSENLYYDIKNDVLDLHSIVGADEYL